MALTHTHTYTGHIAHKGIHHRIINIIQQLAEKIIFSLYFLIELIFFLPCSVVFERMSVALDCLRGSQTANNRLITHKSCPLNAWAADHWAWYLVSCRWLNTVHSVFIFDLLTYKSLCKSLRHIQSNDSKDAFEIMKLNISKQKKSHYKKKTVNKQNLNKVERPFAV